MLVIFLLCLSLGNCQYFTSCISYFLVVQSGITRLHMYCSFLYLHLLYQHLLHLLVTNDLQSPSARKLRLFLLPLPWVNNKRSHPQPYFPSLLFHPAVLRVPPVKPADILDKGKAWTPPLDAIAEVSQRKGPYSSLRVKNCFPHSSRGLTVECFRQGFLHCSTWN